MKENDDTTKSCSPPPQHAQRVAYLDLLRLVATFAVIVIHVYCTEYNSAFPAKRWFLATFGGSSVRWAVPIFVMISGTLFLNPSREVTVRSVLTKRIPRLLLAYVFWWVIYSAILIVESTWLSPWTGMTYTSAYLQPYFHLWFLPMLMGVYLLIPILRKVAADEKVLRYGILVWLCYTLGSFVLVQGLKPLVGEVVPQVFSLFNEQVVVGYAGYFLLGYYLSRVSLTRKQRHILYWLGVFGLLLCIGGNIATSFYLNKSCDLFMEANLGPHVIMMSTALYVWMKAHADSLQSRLAGFMNYVRKDLFGIYLTHAIWLIVFNRSSFRFLCSQAITLPIICIVIFILSLYTTKLIRQIPFLRKVVE